MYFIFQALDFGPLVVELLTLFTHSLQQISDALFLGQDYLLIDNNNNISASCKPEHGIDNYRSHLLESQMFSLLSRGLLSNVIVNLTYSYMPFITEMRIQFVLRWQTGHGKSNLKEGN